MSNLDSRLIFSCPYCQHEIVVEGQNDYSHFLGCLFTCSQCGKTWKFGDTDIVDVLRNRQVIEKHNHKIINFLIELICLCNFLIAADYFIHKSFQQGVFFISLMTILLIMFNINDSENTKTNLIISIISLLALTLVLATLSICLYIKINELNDKNIKLSKQVNLLVDKTDELYVKCTNLS